MESPKVLLLGISYPDVKGHMDKHGYSEKLLVHKTLSVDQAVELVRRGILTEMDARDLARCVATEKVGGGLEAYTVSREVGGVYRKDRHVYANFNNSRGLYNALTQSFGVIKFQQVILDYYWMPTGWLVTRWAKSLFQNTLPDLVRFQMLAYPGSRSRIRKRTGSDSENTDINVNGDEKGDDPSSHPIKSNIELEEGVVFLPFCAHVCKELVGAIHILKKYYAITFVHKDELPGHALWKGTMEIDPNVMQHRLGKRLDQEEIYCTFQPKDIYGSMEDSHVNKDDVMRMLLSIENFEHIRMIRLRPLRQHEPPSVVRKTVIDPEIGGFIGLDWEMGKRRFKEFRSRKRAPLPKQRTFRTVTSSDDSDGDSSDSNSSSDDDSSIGDIDQREMDRYCEETGVFVDIDFDPYNPNRIAETTNFYPSPVLDLVSYINGKEIVDDDNVMDSWAETWGPKASRKKNKKQDLFQNHYQQVRREQKGFLSSNSRLPDPDAEEEEGYKWTLTDDEGWTLALNGDAPDFELIPKVVKRSKQDNIITASRYLFEMKNPGFKTLSRSYGYSFVMSCYQIPKASILFKIEAAKEAERIMIRNTEHEITADTVLEDDVDDGNESSDQMKVETMSIHEMTADEVFKLNPRLVKAYLKSFRLESIPDGTKARRRLLASLLENHHEQLRHKDPLNHLASVALVDDSPTHTSVLSSFAEVALQSPSLPEEATRVAKESIGVFDIVVENCLPPFSPSFQHFYFDLRGTTSFPSELFKLVQSAESMVITHIISWQPKGKSFAVYDKKAFQEKILKECCGGDDSSFDFFLQNLRNFGFVEIQTGSRKGGFRHEYFRRRSPEDVALISAVDENSLEELETTSILSSSGQGESHVKSGRRKSKQTQAPRSQNTEQLTEKKKYNLSRSDVFPAELYRLLEDAHAQGLSDIIGWTRSGKVFAISDEEMFVKKVLSKHSKKPLISYFEASLLAFGFKKTRREMNDRRYQHPNFKKGYPEHASLIAVIKKYDQKGNGTLIATAGDSKRAEGAGCGRNLSGVSQLEETASSEMELMTEVPLPFIGKGDFVESLRLMLDSTPEIPSVKWLSNGAAFTVTDQDEFESKIMPQYFKPMSYSTFRRELKLLGFKPAASGTSMTKTMFHSLFHRDFPELWKLHTDKDLNEKVLYFLAVRLQEQAPVPIEVPDSTTLFGDDKGEWLCLPEFKQLLLDSISEHYELLYVQNGKRLSTAQREFYKKLSTDVIAISALEGKIDTDEKAINACLRKHFRSLFSDARKELESLKISESNNHRMVLNSLIHKAQSGGFKKSMASTVEMTPLESLESAFVNEEKSRMEIEASSDSSKVHKARSVDLVLRANGTGSSVSQSKSRKRRGTSFCGKKKEFNRLKKRRSDDSGCLDQETLSLLTLGSHKLSIPSPEHPSGKEAAQSKTSNGTADNLESSSLTVVPNPTILNLLNGGQRRSERRSNQSTWAHHGSAEKHLPFHLLDSVEEDMDQFRNGRRNEVKEQSRTQVCVKS
ncbi:HSF-type DNA-binding protein [Nitzschia inconspicua]|uniref:HSF-type DNA-binding protein n=1 Tax=Nitzschia inconspicua TaxID=303405 RepID=A0A9K3KR65_9STRA|nr:HSF-type DNA-binding protein [Nitzschia inconspicua]